MDLPLLETPVTGFPLMIDQKKKVWQEVVYEKRIEYCTKCFRQGHVKTVCRTARIERNKKDGRNGILQARNKGDLTMWKEVGKKILRRKI